MKNGFLATIIVASLVTYLAIAYPRFVNSVLGKDATIRDLTAKRLTSGSLSLSGVIENSGNSDLPCSGERFEVISSSGITYRPLTFVCDYDNVAPGTSVNFFSAWVSDRTFASGSYRLRFAKSGGNVDGAFHLGPFTANDLSARTAGGDNTTGAQEAPHATPILSSPESAEPAIPKPTSSEAARMPLFRWAAGQLEVQCFPYFLYGISSNSKPRYSVLFRKSAYSGIARSFDDSKFTREGSATEGSGYSIAAAYDPSHRIFVAENWQGDDYFNDIVITNVGAPPVPVREQNLTKIPGLDHSPLIGESMDEVESRLGPAMASGPCRGMTAVTYRHDAPGQAAARDTIIFLNGRVVAAAYDGD